MHHSDCRGRPYISHILWRGRLNVQRCYMLVCLGGLQPSSLPATEWLINDMVNHM